MVNPSSWIEITSHQKLRCSTAHRIHIYLRWDLHGCHFCHFCSFQYPFLFITTHIYISKLVRFSISYIICKLWRYCYCWKTRFVMYNYCFFCFFFSIRVLFYGHWQLTGQQGKGGCHLLPLYHFHPLTNIQTFICSFAREMTITYF